MHPAGQIWTVYLGNQWFRYVCYFLLVKIDYYRSKITNLFELLIIEMNDPNLSYRTPYRICTIWNSHRNMYDSLDWPRPLDSSKCQHDPHTKYKLPNPNGIQPSIWTHSIIQRYLGLVSQKNTYNNLDLLFWFYLSFFLHLCPSFYRLLVRLNKINLKSKKNYTFTEIFF